jgi:hypothetical protein
MDVEKGKKWVLEKLERSWKKIMPEARKIIDKQYKAIKLLLKTEIG